MRELEYALLSAQGLTDAKKRSMALVGAAVKQARTLELIAQALEDAEFAARSIPDPVAREESMDAVHKAMKRVGYNRIQKTFQIRSSAIDPR